MGSAIKALIYIAVAAFTIYAIFISDNKNLYGYAIIAMGLVGYYMFREDWEARKSQRGVKASGTV